MPERFLRAMEVGIRAHVGLLGGILPRVSPEYVVVASALHGLLIEDGGLDVRMEQPIPGRQRQKCDLVVRARDRGEPYYFEFKATWPKGVGENVGGIRKDLAKLKGLQRGYCIAFAFALAEVPKGCEHHRSSATRNLDWTVDQLRKRLQIDPIFQTDAFDVDRIPTRGSARLLAWKA